MKTLSFLLLAIVFTICLSTTITSALTIDGSNIEEFFKTGGQMSQEKNQISAADLQKIEDELYLSLLQDMEQSGSTLDIENDSNLSGGFDLSILRQRAAYASIARCLTTSVASVLNWSCTWCKDGSKVPKLTEVTGGIEGKSKLGWYVGYDANNKRIVAVFKSTGGVENWLLDLDFSMISYNSCPTCKAHKGFFLGYTDQVRNVVVKAVIDLQKKHPQAVVVITGHSLGGALTTHAAIDFHDGLFTSLNFNGIDIVHNTNNSLYNQISDETFTHLYALEHGITFTTAQNKLFSHRLTSNGSNNTNLLDDNLTGTKFNLEFPIYNFGSPRVFNQAGSDWFNARMGRANFRRVSHVGDTVTHVPTITLGGRHVGNEVYFHEKNLSMNYRICDMADSEDKTCGYKDIAIDFLQHRWYGGYDMLQNDADCK